MGAHTFTETSSTKDVGQAFRELVAAALHEYGHDPYNGSISTADGYTVVSERPISATAARQLVESRIENLHKWAACEAVAVGKPTKTIKRKVWCDIDTTAIGHWSVRPTAETVAAALGVPAARVESFTILESKPKYKTTTRPAGPARKFWTTADGGEFTTKGEAVAYAKRRLELDRAAASGPAGLVTAVVPVREIAVYQATVRTPEAAVVRTAVSWRVKVEATIAASEELEFDHWLFYGWAAT